MADRIWQRHKGAGVNQSRLVTKEIVKYIEVYIHHLRKKLGKNLIRTVYGVGNTIPKYTS